MMDSKARTHWYVMGIYALLYNRTGLEGVIIFGFMVITSLLMSIAGNVKDEDEL